MNELKLKPELERELRLLSDGYLYDLAVQFVDDHSLLSNSQISGLENNVLTARGLSDIRRFAKHQADKNDPGKEKRPNPKKVAIFDFFHDLTGKLNLLEEKAKSDKSEGGFGFVSPTIFAEQKELIANGEFKGKEKKKWNKKYNASREFHGLILAREFIHHVSAHHRYKSEGN